MPAQRVSIPGRGLRIGKGLNAGNEASLFLRQSPFPVMPNNHLLTPYILQIRVIRVIRAEKSSWRVLRLGERWIHFVNGIGYFAPNARRRTPDTAPPLGLHSPLCVTRRVHFVPHQKRIAPTLRPMRYALCLPHPWPMSSYPAVTTTGRASLWGSP